MRKIVKKIGESQIMKDKNGKNFKTIQVESLSQTFEEIPGVGKVPVGAKTKTASTNVYEENYLPNPEKDYGYDTPVGTYMEGSIETRDVQPYDVPRMGQEPHKASTYTCVVFGDSTSPSWETLVRSTFRQKGHIVVDKPMMSPVRSGDLLIPIKDETAGQ